jgi:hypothetical protein
VTGAKVARHTLTGANKVATLGTVPNAARLGGQLPSTFQSRVSGSCAPGQAIAAVAASGSVSCAATGQRTITGVTAGSGLSGGGSSGAVTLAVPDGGIGTAQLADGSVTSSKFAVGAEAPNAAELGGLVPVFVANGGSIQFNTIGVADMTTSTPASGAHVTVGAHFSNEDLYVDLITAHDPNGDITGTAGCYGYALVTAS